MRPSWEQTFLDVAEVWSRRATCPRASVGAVIVKDNRVLSSGYNGASEGEPHCIDAGCIIEDNHCQRSLHAEVNAIAYAARAGIPIEGASIYVYGHQGICRECTKVIRSAGIKNVVHHQA